MWATSCGAATEADHRAREILTRVGDKWSVIVLYQLGEDTMRFTELLRTVPGISQRVLAVTLRGLERDGLVSRTVHPVVPPHVDYRLTPLGETLKETVTSLVRWTHEHLDDIDRARESYDETNGGPPRRPAVPDSDLRPR
ncbi:winged helix-turn-helix transcriptional regulator [Streptosporangium saharense]|uniref:winged helix-turn-helix transcriptional regulator n=1 Tax=Streptosporangium saharense TaxID=1706840 RepID=UPI0036872C31